MRYTQRLVEDGFIDQAQKAVKRHSTIEIKFTNDEAGLADKLTQHYMTLAHNTAAKGSGSRNIKKDLLPTTEPKEEKTPPRIKHNAKGAMDVIDLGDDDSNTYPDPRDAPPPKPKGM